jgi:hypothetical protein
MIDIVLKSDFRLADIRIPPAVWDDLYDAATHPANVGVRSVHQLFDCEKAVKLFRASLQFARQLVLIPIVVHLLPAMLSN